MEKEKVIALIKQKKWYHSFELVPGVVTPGSCPVNPGSVLDSLGIPEDLTGMKVLDIGAWDGPYTFEFERRGAQVTALDIQDPDHTGFNVSKQILNANAEYIVGSVNELPAELTHQFDIVFYQGVYYHLKNPMQAFANIWNVLKNDAIVYFGGALLDHADLVDPFWKDKKDILNKITPLPVSYFVKDNYRVHDPSCWFIPTKVCLEHWLLASGFKNIIIHVSINNSSSSGQALKDGNFKHFEHGFV